MPKVRCQYDDDRMKDAIRAVQEGMSGRSASIKYNVPRTTLRNKLNGKSPEESKLGRNPVLTNTEEKTLVEWILKCRKRGLPPSKDDILNSIQDIIMADKTRKTPFTNNRPGKSWLSLFKKRHPILSEDGQNVSERNSFSAEENSSSRSPQTEETIDGWFQVLKEELNNLESLDILNDPSRVFCSDEVNIELCSQTGRVIGLKPWEDVYELPPGPDKSTMSFLRTFCANGEVVSPALIYPYTPQVPSNILNSLPKTFYVGSSESGWIKSETLLDFLATSFIPWLEAQGVKRPVILFVNGETTHIRVQLSEFCEENEIILYLLPRNCAGVLHPARELQPFKDTWNTAVSQRYSSASSLRIADVAPLLSGILDAMSPQGISDSFASSGLCPLNPERVNLSRVYSDTKPDLQSSSDSRYAHAKAVMMEFLPKRKIELLNKNVGGDKGLRELWRFIHFKIEKEAASALSEAPPLNYEIALPAKRMMFISLDTTSDEGVSSPTIEPQEDVSSPPQFSYVIVNQ